MSEIVYRELDTCIVVENVGLAPMDPLDEENTPSTVSGFVPCDENMSATCDEFCWRAVLSLC